MDLSLLPTFMVFADTLNFVRAGARLHLSQPAVHLQVRKLEAELGVALYQRRGRTLELTAEGKLLRAFAAETRGRTDDFLATLRGESAERPAVLAAGEGAFLYLLGPAIRKHGAPLRLLTKDHDAAREAVLSGEADAGVIASSEGAAEAKAGLVSRVLTRVGSLLVVPADHPLAKRRTARLRDLRGARLIVPPAGRPHREAIGRALSQAEVDWQVAVEASGWELAVHFAGLGIGLTIVNACCRLPASLRGIPLTGLPTVEYRVIHTQRGLERPRTRALVDTLHSSANAWRTGREGGSSGR